MFWIWAASWGLFSPFIFSARRFTLATNWSIFFS